MADRTTSDTRKVTVHECDHLRTIVRDRDGTWTHIDADGALGGACGASSVYRLEITPAEPAQLAHNISRYAGART